MQINHKRITRRRPSSSFLYLTLLIMCIFFHFRTEAKTHFSNSFFFSAILCLWRMPLTLANLLASVRRPIGIRRRKHSVVAHKATVERYMPLTIHLAISGLAAHCAANANEKLGQHNFEKKARAKSGRKNKL